ncbi:MAG: phytoene/squalene synthase family protein [Candidatus Zixiibacteriota bacterium]|nr:MAG: phytoene/squalene synthase family protein [candidate division Zixibacteria bacterium]
MPDTQALKFCVEILPQVSRTFAINIRVLKGELYRAVLVAYLFCRIVDTVEDAEDLSIDLRNRLLDEYMAFFEAPVLDARRLSEWIALFGHLDPSDPQQRLIQNCPFVFAVFSDLPVSTRAIMSGCVLEMAAGMKKTNNRQQPQESFHSLQTMTDLEEYCYYVAGTVGIMLTRLFAAYSKSLEPSAAQKMADLQLSFALGLQMTNIIKDCFEDYRRGWCYIPTELAAKHGVPIAEFFASPHRQQSLATLDDLVIKTAKHLDDALDYTLLLPRTEIRLRLFNLWSLFFAVKTLSKAWHNKDLLSGEVKVKISRCEVYKTLAQTTLLVTSDALLRRLYHRFRDKIAL